MHMWFLAGREGEAREVKRSVGKGLIGLTLARPTTLMAMFEQSSALICTSSFSKRAGSSGLLKNPISVCMCMWLKGEGKRRRGGMYVIEASVRFVEERYARGCGEE